jgi:hypothetical protein
MELEMQPIPQRPPTDPRAKSCFQPPQNDAVDRLLQACTQRTTQSAQPTQANAQNEALKKRILFLARALPNARWPMFFLKAPPKTIQNLLELCNSITYFSHSQAMIQCTPGLFTTRQRTLSGLSNKILDHFQATFIWLENTLYLINQLHHQPDHELDKIQKDYTRMYEANRKACEYAPCHEILLHNPFTQAMAWRRKNSSQSMRALAALEQNILHFILSHSWMNAYRPKRAPQKPLYPAFTLPGTMKNEAVIKMADIKCLMHSNESGTKKALLEAAHLFYLTSYNAKHHLMNLPYPTSEQKKTLRTLLNDMKLLRQFALSAHMIINLDFEQPKKNKPTQHKKGAHPNPPPRFFEPEIAKMITDFAEPVQILPLSHPRSKEKIITYT